MARKQKRHAVISMEEARRAVYVDCEGLKDTSPTLMGVLLDDVFEQVVFDPELEPAARKKGLRMSTFEAEAARLKELSYRELRVIIAYSEHELRLFRHYAGIDIGMWYRNARMIAKRWKNREHPEAHVAGHGLKDYLKFIRYPMGRYLANKPPAEIIKEIREMLRKRGSYGELTPRKKADWTKLLEYNRVDCEGMRELVRTTLEKG